MESIERGIPAFVSLAMLWRGVLKKFWRVAMFATRRSVVFAVWPVNLSGASASAALTLLMFAACLLPSMASAQLAQPGEPEVAINRWRWAVADQTELRVVALDARRQQVVVKWSANDLSVLRRGMQVPGLAVALEEVSGNVAVFLPVNLPGQEAVERIEIALVDGLQTTRLIRFQAPARSMKDGWMVVSP